MLQSDVKARRLDGIMAQLFHLLCFPTHQFADFLHVKLTLSFIRFVVNGVYMEDDKRIERDPFGEVLVPKSKYYGAFTYRALTNFQFSDLRFPRELIRALGLIKYAAAYANLKLKILDEKIAGPIMQASMEVAEGLFDEEFPVDVFQTGSGTSIHMNVNEVIAARASEIMGGPRSASGPIHPNDHVNFGQSTNDVFPTAIRVALLELINKKLLPSLDTLYEELLGKSDEFKYVVKAGRTHLRDALPVTLGQEFSGYAMMIKKARMEIEKTMQVLEELPIGGTAVGTGFNTHPEFPGLVIESLREITGLNVREAENRFEAIGSAGAFVALSSTLKNLACAIVKICNDLRLLSSGPNTGFGEIEIPALQLGSSMMPGKVNPVILEAACQAGVKVIANDVCVTIASQLGELELNMGLPLIAYVLIQSVKLMTNTCSALSNKCIKGIKADSERCRAYAESSAAILTALAPVIGYEKTTELVKKALLKKKSLRAILAEDFGMREDEIDRILDIKRMTMPGFFTKNNAQQRK